MATAGVYMGEETQMDGALEGSGSLTGSGTYMGEDFATLDSHILGARPKERLTEEEKLAKDCMRRRQLELERRARIFDAKRRIIGVDKEALDAQVAENAQRRAQQKANDKAADREHLRIAQQTKMVEQDRQRAKKELERSCKEYSLQTLNFESRREFDLNDPHAIRKGTPHRIGDADPRLGPASMQQFGGEDLMREERLKQQKAAQVSFIEQQKFEKAMMSNQGKDDDLAFAKQTAEITALRNEIEESEASLRRELQRSQHEENVSQAYQDQNRRMQEQELNAAANDAELLHHATDTFLNETAEPYYGHRIRRDAYKGSTRDERIQVAAVQRDMEEDNHRQKAQNKADDMVFANTVEATRKQLVAMEREKQRTRRAVQEQIARENKNLQLEQREKTARTNQLYRNEFKPEFFQQFGTGIR